jgi:hypothetical protein
MAHATGGLVCSNDPELAKHRGAYPWLATETDRVYGATYDAGVGWRFHRRQLEQPWMVKPTTGRRRKSDAAESAEHSLAAPATAFVAALQADLHQLAARGEA